MSGTNGNTPTATRDTGMLICTRSFTADLDGERITIVAGRDRVGADHPLAHSHAQNFAPAPPSPFHARDVEDRMTGRPGRTPVDRSLEQELAIRRRRLAELDRRERERPMRASPDAQAAFWSGVEQLLADPAQEREERESRELIAEVDAARARTMREEREDLGGWVDQ